jgi:hypothetical protein
MIKQLRLNTLQNTRKSYARIIRDFMADEMNVEKGRAVAYMLNGYLQFWKLEADLRIEDRLQAIEDKLSQKNQEADW